MIFFYELVLNGTVIASTSNFRINEKGFAFKTGHDRAYATACPGILAEYAFLESGAASRMGLDEIESGSWVGSFMEGLWPDRIPIVSGHFFAGKMPAVWLRAGPTSRGEIERVGTTDGLNAVRRRVHAQVL